VQLKQASNALKTGKGKAAPAKSNAFDQMEDIGEPVLADDPPPDEEEEQQDEDNDIGIIG
jgi:hypothetical protein